MNFIRKILRWLGYSIAIVIILMALVVSVARLLTPSLNQHRTQIESWIFQLFHVPIKIQTIAITWHGYEPELRLENPAILDQVTHQPIFKIKALQINLLLWKSLFHWRLFPEDIVIEGASLTLSENKTGRIYLKNWDQLLVTDASLAGTSAGGESVTADQVIHWILTQPFLNLRDIRIEFIPFQQAKRIIYLNFLSLHNTHHRHILRGEAALQQNFSTHLTINLQWRGTLFDSAHPSESMDLYLFLEKIDCSDWISQFVWHQLQIKSGTGNAEIWANWQHGQLQKIQTQFQLNNLQFKLFPAQKIIPIERLSGHIGWKQDGAGQLIAGENILIHHANAEITIPKIKILNINNINNKIKNLNFLNANLIIPNTDIAFNHMNGNINFSDQAIQNGAIQGQLANQPIQMTITAGVLHLIADHLTIIEQPLTHLNAQLKKALNQWELAVQSDQIIGKLIFPIDTNSQKKIDINCERFHFLPLVLGEKQTLDPHTLPAFSFAAQDVKYRDTYLGNMRLDVTPNATGITIDKFYLSSNLFDLRTTGEWSFIGNKHETHLQGQLNTLNVSQFLNHWDLGVDSLIASNGSAVFQLKWPDAPYDPSLIDLSGDIGLKMGKGSVIHLKRSTNTEVGFGRMLNILNLQSLPRRLTLDFSDLSQQGYNFDTMQGNFHLEEGNAITQDTQFDGPVALLEIKGRIGLTTKDYDIIFNVTPYVTGSIPVVAALAGGPVIGAATWLAEKVAGKIVSKAVTYHYLVTGSWDDPVIKSR